MALTDEEADCLARLASTMPPTAREGFIREVAGKLAAYPIQQRGVGLAYRLAAEAQHGFINLAVGHSRKYGRVRSGR